MGCWNGTCGLSNLPIKNGEEIVLFIVKEKNLLNCNGGGYCYPTDLFEPISLPIVGEYDDYGAIENIKNEDLILPKIREMFKEKNLINLLDEISDLDMNTASLYQIIREIERGNIASPENPSILKLYESEGIIKSRYLNVGIIMFHKKLYDTVIKKVYSGCHKKRYLDIIESSKDALEGDLKYLDNIKKAILWKASRIPFEFTIDYLIDSVLNSDDKLLDKIVEVDTINSVLLSLRKSWIPQCGAGSQEYIHSEYVSVANFILEKYKEEQEELD